MIPLSKKMKHIPPSMTLELNNRVKALKAQGVDVVSFSVGEPDFDTPHHIKEVAIRALQAGFTKYTPAEGIPELRQAFTKNLNEELGTDYDWTQTVVSNGSKHSIYNFLQAALDPGDEVIVPAPYWLSYPAMIELSGGKPKIVNMSEKEGFKLTPQKLKGAITRKTKAILINSPSNPTGATYSKEELKSLAPILESAPMWVLSDEAYCDILYDGVTFFSPAQLSKKIFDKTVIFRTCSKSYAMTGWRVGFSTGPKELMKAIGALQSQATSGINAFAQKGAVSAFSEQQSQDGLKVMVKTFASRRELALRLLDEIPGIRAFKPQGAFYLFLNVSAFYGKKYKGIKMTHSIHLSEFLLDQAQVVVIPGEPFGADKYIRLSFATSEENIEKGLGRMKEALSKLS